MNTVAEVANLQICWQGTTCAQSIFTTMTLLLEELQRHCKCDAMHWKADTVDADPELESWSKNQTWNNPKVPTIFFLNLSNKRWCLYAAMRWGGERKVKRFLIGYHNSRKKLSEKYDTVLMILSKLMFAMVCLSSGCCIILYAWRQRKKSTMVYSWGFVCRNVKCVNRKCSGIGLCNGFKSSQLR